MHEIFVTVMEREKLQILFEILVKNVRQISKLIIKAINSEKPNKGHSKFFFRNTGFIVKNPDAPSNYEPFYMLYFSEIKFGVGHFQSIRPKTEESLYSSNILTGIPNNNNSVVTSPIVNLNCQRSQLQGIPYVMGHRKCQISMFV